MKAKYGFDLPLGLQHDFAQVVQVQADTGRRIDVDQIGGIFDREYMLRKPTACLLLKCTAASPQVRLASAGFRLRRSQFVRRPGRDPALVCADKLANMGLDVNVLDIHSHRVGSSGRFVVYVRCMVGVPIWGVGIAGDAINASLRAVLSAVGRGTGSSLSRRRRMHPLLAKL